MSHNILKPKLYIPRAVYQKLSHFVDKCKIEVSGFGLCTHVEDKNYFWIRDVFLLEQEAGSAHTDIDATALGKLEYECIRDKKEGDLNFWWHSHVNMETFWSGTDRDTIESIGANGYCLASVLNKKGSIRTALAYKGRFGLVFVDEMDTVIYDAPPTKELIETWDKELEDKVKEPPVRMPLSYLDSANYGRQGSLLTGLSHKSNHWPPKKIKLVKRIKLKDARHKAAVWADSCPEILNDLELFLMACAANTHPFEFDVKSMDFDMDTYEEIDRLVKEFKVTHPLFTLEEFKNVNTKSTPDKTSQHNSMY